MAEANLIDLWAVRSLNAAGTMSPGATSVNASSLTATRALYAVARDGESTCDERSTNTVGYRIDYVFVQSPRPEHSFLVDYRRPFRHVTEVSPPAGGMQYLSDHLGLDDLLFTSPRD